MNINYTGKIVKCGNTSLLYKSQVHPDIKLLITIENDEIIFEGECNSIDINNEIIQEWFRESNRNLDFVVNKINDKYGEKALGFDDNEDNIDIISNFSPSLKWNRQRNLNIYTWGKKHRKK